MASLFNTLIFFIIFLFFAFWLIYAFGFLLIGKSGDETEKTEKIALSLTLGSVLFILVAFLLSLLHLRFLVLPFLVLTSLLSLIMYRKKLFIPWLIFKEKKLLLLLVVIGILIQGFINFPSGFLYQDGMLFWSSQGHDGLWHVASMEQVKYALPLQNPGFSGESLYNYHYLVDVLMGEFLRIFPFFSALDLYFRFFPVLFSLMIGMSVYAFLTRWQKNQQIGFLGLFFLYFTGSFGYIVKFIKEGSILGGETVFWAAQQNTILGNPPHAMSHAILPAFFLSFFLFLKHKTKYWFLISFLIGSVLAGFKVSGGLVMLVGLGAASLSSFLSQRSFAVLILTFLLGLSNFATFKALTSPTASSFLMFLPWWFVRTTIVDRLGWMDLELRRQYYFAQGTWRGFLRVLEFETIAFLIFVIGNLGMRIIGLVVLAKKLIKDNFSLFRDPIEVMLLASMITGLVIPMIFVQKGLIYNNIQFMQYFLLIFGFYAAIAVYKILQMVKIIPFKIAVIFLIAILSLPTVIGNLTELYGSDKSPLAKISFAHLEALKYLKDNSLPSDRILNPPFNPSLKGNFNTQPKPIYAWYDTPYISALSGRRSYLSSEHVTLLDYPDTKLRQDNMNKFFSQEDIFWNQNFLKNAKINYIYLAKDEIQIPLDLTKNHLKLFFENNEVLIYQVTVD